MLAINAFLRGLWVGILAVLIWGVLSGLTGWGWMLPQTQWVFLLTMLVAGLAKIVRASVKCAERHHSGLPTIRSAPIRQR